MRFPGYRWGVLGALDVAPTSARMRFLEAWAEVEGGTASFNAWNTTYDLAGATRYNSVGVRNYRDPLQGVAAALLTLRLAAYVELVAALRAPDLTAREIAQRSVHALDTWGTGGAAVISHLRQHP